jgi:cell division protein FtsW (lipid II flippase)
MEQKSKFIWKERDSNIFAVISLFSGLGMLYLYWDGYFKYNLVSSDTFNFNNAEWAFILMGLCAISLILLVVSKN